jgi:hypothetical protein
MFNDLSDGLATNFAWQHDARFHSKAEFPELFRDDIALSVKEKGNDGVTNQLVTLFDNSAEDVEHTLEFSRGLLLEVTYPSAPLPPSPQESENGDVTQHTSTHNQDSGYTVKMIRSYDHPQAPLSTSQGSLQVIPSADETKDSKVFVGYGYNALFSEYSADGALLCDSHFATNYSWGSGEVQSYRAFRFPWTGLPVDPPTAVLSGDGQVYVSWNGATEVRGWTLQHSPTYPAAENDWEDVLLVDKTGFETVINIQDEDLLRYIRVKAVDENGVMLGLSREIDMGWSAELSSAMPQFKVTTTSAPINLVVLVCINVTIVFIVCELSSRISVWRRTRKWRHRKGIRLSSDA